MAYFQDGAGYNESGERQFIDGFLHAGVNLDHWWIDAGWFEGGDVSWWDSVGNWEPDRERFPRGLKAVSDHVHARGLKMIVWFEPERVAAGTWLAENHPAMDSWRQQRWTLEPGLLGSPHLAHRSCR